MFIPFSQLFIVLIVIFLVLTLIEYKKRRSNVYRAVAQFEGPNLIPIFGYSQLFLGNAYEIFHRALNWIKEYSSPIKLWVFGNAYFIVYDADQVQKILQSPKTTKKGYIYKFLRPWAGTGLLTAPVKKWRVHRKLIVPTFHIKILETFIKSFIKQSETMTEQLRIHVGKGEFELFDYVSRCTLDIVCETAMDIPLNAQTDPENKYVQKAKRMMDIMSIRAFTLYLYPNILFNNSRYGLEHKECIKYLHEAADEIIRKKRIEIVNRDNGTIESVNGLKLKTFLDYLMELSDNEKYLSDEEVRDEVNTLMIAGTETTASVNCFTMVMLANFPDIQEKVYNELWEIFGDSLFDDHLDITLEHLNRMEYLERVLKETMRLFPIGPFIMREIISDFDIDGHTLPKGSSLIIAIIELHRSEKYWDNPLEFNPDRFLPERSVNRHPYCYIPFSAGPRNCIGLKYSMMSMKTLLAVVLRHYILKKNEITKIEDMELDIHVTLKLLKPFSIKIENRINHKHQ